MRQVLGLLFVIVLSSLQAQVIKGKVVDKDTGEGLIGTHVYLVKNWRAGTTTDINGAYELQITEEDKSDSLLISFVGFEEQVVPVGDNLTIRLSPITFQGEEVVITAEPLVAEEFKYMKIKKIDIYTNPAASADPVLAVNSLPSATTTDESANISLRGSSPAETGIFLNGVPVYDAVRYAQLNGIGTFSIFNTSIIKNVTVFPGNPPLEYGNVTSGTIALDTDDRILEGSGNSAIIIMANVGFSREQRISDNQSLKVFTNWQPSKVIKAVNKESLKNIKSFNSVDLGLYWYGSKENWSWKVFSYNLLEGYQFVFRHPTFKGIFDQDKKRSFLVSSVTRQLQHGALVLNVGLSATRADFTFSTAKFNSRKKDLYSAISYQFNKDKLSIKTGLSFDYRQSKTEGRVHRFPHAVGTEHPTINIKGAVDSKTPESFVYAKYLVTDRLTLGGGLRTNALMKKDSYLSRQINASYALNGWSFTLGMGKYHKNSLTERRGERLNAESQQYSLDIKYEEDDLKSSLSFFRKEATLNGGNYDVSGAELFVDRRFNSKLSASASFTWMDAKSKSSKAYPYDLSYFIKGNLSYQPGKSWTIESVVTAREGVSVLPVEGSNFDQGLNVYTPVYAQSSERLPAYFSVGLSVSKIFPISDKMNLIGFASVNNLTNHKNVRKYDYVRDYSSFTPSLFSSRTAYAGVIINF